MASSDNEPFTIIGEIEGEVMADPSETGGFMSKLNTGKDWIYSKKASLKPWSEFCNVKKVSLPRTVGEATRRIFGNLSKFQSNYVFLCLALGLYCIITNPLLLFGMALCLAVWWFVSIKKGGENVNIVGREFSPKEIYIVLFVIAVPLFYFAAAGSTVFWVIGASIVVVLSHAVFLSVAMDTTDDIQLEEITIS